MLNLKRPKAREWSQWDRQTACSADVSEAIVRHAAVGDLTVLQELPATIASANTSRPGISGRDQRAMVCQDSIGPHNPRSQRGHFADWLHSAGKQPCEEGQYGRGFGSAMATET